MHLINRYIGRAVISSIVIVLLVVLSLDILSSIVDQFDKLGGNYHLGELLVYVGLLLPATIYEYLPLACLVGCLIGLGQLASGSELTIVQASGVSAVRIVIIVMRYILLFVVAGLLLGEYIAPPFTQYAESRRAEALGRDNKRAVLEGVWNREGNTFMQFSGVLPGGKIVGITRYELDDSGKLIRASLSQSAQFYGGETKRQRFALGRKADQYWIERDIKITHFDETSTRTEQLESRRWETELTPSLLSVLVLDSDELPMTRLWGYSQYLKQQGIDAGSYLLAFWQKALQPFSIFALVLIAISFILGPLRQTTVGYKVFIGVLVGLVFQTVQKLLGPSSLLLGFSPFIAVALPIILSGLFGFVLLRLQRA